MFEVTPMFWQNGSFVLRRREEEGSKGRLYMQAHGYDTGLREVVLEWTTRIKPIAASLQFTPSPGWIDWMTQKNKIYSSEIFLTN